MIIVMTETADMLEMLGERAYRKRGEKHG